MPILFKPTGSSIPPTVQLFTATGTGTGYLFQVSGISVAPTAGATYTNNSVTYTVIGITNGNALLWCSVAGGKRLAVQH